MFFFIVFNKENTFAYYNDIIILLFYIWVTDLSLQLTDQPLDRLYAEKQKTNAG